MTIIHLLQPLGLLLLVSSGIEVEGIQESQQGQGYNAQVSVSKESLMPSPEQPISSGDSISHLHPGQHATLDSIVDKISQDLLHAKLLPHQLEKQAAAEEAKNLDEYHAERIADAKRRERAQRIIKVFRVKQMLDQDQNEAGGGGGRRQRRRQRKYMKHRNRKW